MFCKAQITLQIDASGTTLTTSTAEKECWSPNLSANSCTEASVRAQPETRDYTRMSSRVLKSDDSKLLKASAAQARFHLVHRSGPNRYRLGAEESAIFTLKQVFVGSLTLLACISQFVGGQS
jgi:hypothetical protein